MLATLASLVIAGAGVAALVAVAATWRGQLGALRQLLADARALEQADALELDRAFLARLVQCESIAEPAMAETAPALRPAIRVTRRPAPRPACAAGATGSRRAAA